MRPAAPTVNVPRLSEPSRTSTVRGWLPTGLKWILSSPVVPTTIRLPSLARWADAGGTAIVASLTAWAVGAFS